MDPRLLDAVQTLLDGPGGLFRRDDTRGFARLRTNEVVEVVVPDRLDAGQWQVFFVDLRSRNPEGPFENKGPCPSPEQGYVDVRILIERSEADGTD